MLWSLGHSLTLNLCLSIGALSTSSPSSGSLLKSRVIKTWGKLSKTMMFQISDLKHFKLHRITVKKSYKEPATRDCKLAQFGSELSWLLGPFKSSCSLYTCVAHLICHGKDIKWWWSLWPKPWTGAAEWRRAARTGWGSGVARVSSGWCLTPSGTCPRPRRRLRSLMSLVTSEPQRRPLMVSWSPGRSSSLETASRHPQCPPHNYPRPGWHQEAGPIRY